MAIGECDAIVDMTLIRSDL